jgi:hypothetical protein
MKPILIAGISIVNLALIAYTFAIVSQLKGKVMSRKVLSFLTIGVVLDVSATICMIIGSGHFVTVHGIIGYSSLTGMLMDTVLSYRHTWRNGPGSPLTARFNRGSRIAYYYWVLAYITGAMIVMMK